MATLQCKWSLLLSELENANAGMDAHLGMEMVDDDDVSEIGCDDDDDDGNDDESPFTEMADIALWVRW